MTSPPKTALVAEDNAALRRVIAFALGGCGFEVSAAPDGLEAWQIAQQRSFDLVVTDQQMPHLTGVELIDRLRGSERNGATPIILLTAKGLELDSESLRARYGVAAMLCKPFSPSRLAALAEELVSQPA